MNWDDGKKLYLKVYSAKDEAWLNVGLGTFRSTHILSLNQKARQKASEIIVIAAIILYIYTVPFISQVSRLQCLADGRCNNHRTHPWRGCGSRHTARQDPLLPRQPPGARFWTRWSVFEWTSSTFVSIAGATSSSLICFCWRGGYFGFVWFGLRLGLLKNWQVSSTFQPFLGRNLMCLK